MASRSVLEVVMAGLLCGVLCCAAQAATITAVRCAKAPQIDGRLDDACWQSAAVVSQFALLSGEAAPSPTEVRLCFDDDALYLGFKCSQAGAPKAEAKGRDGAVFADDCVDVYLDPTHDRFNYFHFAVNAAGVRYDERCDGVGIDPKWDSVWQAATAKTGDGWTCEIALPWTALDPMSSFRKTMGLNLLRRFAGDGIATWAPVGERLENTDKFGDLAGLDVDFSPFFTKVHLPVLIEPCEGHNVIPFRLTDARPGGSFALECTTRQAEAVAGTPAGGALVDGIPSDSEGAGSAKVNLTFPRAGKYRVAFLLRDRRTNRALWTAERVVECKPLAHLTLFESFYRSEVKMRIIAGERAARYRLHTAQADAQSADFYADEDHALKPGEQWLSFPWSHAEPGEYSIAADFIGPDGKAAQSEILRFYRSRNPALKSPRVDIRDDNMLTVDGKPFFPIAIYAAPSETDEGYAKVADMGYNVVRSSEQMLDTAQKHGLMVWLGVGQWFDLRQNREANLKALADFVGRVKNHPALVVYESQDEPTWRQLPLDLFVEGYHELKRLDPNHPLWTNHAPRNTVEDLTIYARSSDIIGTDMYPVPEPQAHSDLATKTLAVAGEETDKQRLTVADTKPVFMVLQGFSWGEILTDPTNKANPRYPTHEENRFIAYDSIVHGANGLLYWGTHAIERPSYWTDLTRVTRELGKMAPVLAWRDDAAAAKAAVVSGPIDVLVKRDGAQWVLIAVNRSNQPARATLRVPAPGSAAVLFEGRTVGADGQVADDFGPYGVHIYAAADSALAREMAKMSF